MTVARERIVMAGCIVLSRFLVDNCAPRTAIPFRIGRIADTGYGSGFVAGIDGLVSFCVITDNRIGIRIGFVVVLVIGVVVIVRVVDLHCNIGIGIYERIQIFISVGRKFIGVDVDVVSA